MHDALCDGRISVRHARAVVDAGGPLTPDARASLDQAAVPFAEQSTPGDLKRIVKKQAAELAPLSLRERHERERARRFVTLTERDDGMSDLVIYLPTFEGRALYDRATEMAKIVTADRRRARRAHDREGGHAVDDAAPAAATDLRTLDQLRVDILTDILLSAEPTGHDLHASGTGATLADVQATVQVTIPVDQMIDPDDGTSWIDEGGRVSPNTARIVAGSAAGWERLFYRPDSGTIERVDHYRPSAAQRRALIGRDMTCRFPGCTVPARKSDIDHSHDYARGGQTAQSNLAALCEGHHMMKHGSGWTLRQLADGVIEWTSPAGRTHRDEPASRVFFQPAPSPTRDDDRPEWARDGDPPENRGDFRAHVESLEAKRRADERSAHERRIVQDRDARNNAAARARAAERADDNSDRKEGW